MKSTASKAGRADEHAGQPDDKVIEVKDSEGRNAPEAPEEQTATFSAVPSGDADPGSAEDGATPGAEASAEDGVKPGEETSAEQDANAATGSGPLAAPVMTTAEPEADSPETPARAKDAVVTDPEAQVPSPDPAVVSPGPEAASPGAEVTAPEAPIAPPESATARSEASATGPEDPSPEPEVHGPRAALTGPEDAAAGPVSTVTAPEPASLFEPKVHQPSTNELTTDQAMDEQATDDGTTDDQATDDQTTDDQATDPQATDEQTTDDQTTDDQTTAGQARDEDGAADPATGDGSTNDGSADGPTAPEAGPGEAGPAGDGDGASPAGEGEGSLFRAVRPVRPAEPVREVPLPKPVSRALTAALTGLKHSVTGLRLGLDVPGVEEARKAQVEILAQLDDYVIPRVHMSTAPALVVIAGSTGAGKSTLVNTLAAAKVSATGVRRPTTGTPVLACHPDDREWFAKSDVLGGMVRVARPGPDSSLDTLVLAASERLPPGLALLDTPDIDSVVESHHEIAHRMLDAADLWVFVTTATRYADAPAWNLLRLAKERGARLAIVLSRVPVRSREVVEKHFARMLQEYGLGEVERFVVNESKVTGGRLPDEDVAELRMWLTELSVDDQRRAQAIQATLDGVLNSFRSRLPALARHLEAQVAFRAELRTDVDAAYMGALAEIDRATSDGSILRGEVLARWQDFAGSGDMMRTLHLRRPGRAASKTGQQAPARLRAFKAALRAGLESVIISAGQRAAEEAVARWRQRAGVGDGLAAAPGLGRSSEELPRRAARTVAAWQEHVVALIRSGGVAKRSVAKVVAFDEEALALVFMVGLLGYGNSDIAASSGTGTLPERLLRGVLGAESLRAIGTRARTDLRARVSVLFDEETLRYVQVLDEAGIPDEAASKRLYQATYNLEVSR
ncbi:GTPase [Sphaerisporangium sp. TRM90804]|uniref:GTPase n=1 Tax=Sphaerisporangium sp. TRM90804 TaxID=3031113 RepID=UPI002449E76E|nr:GTPase [Sphaerisporangium sp. TRM90804]MDH2429729.1 50S ribosome-binding GTPase [Sphaerisporangium sp. TRM90804]